MMCRQGMWEDTDDEIKKKKSGGILIRTGNWMVCRKGEWEGKGND